MILAESVSDDMIVRSRNRRSQAFARRCTGNGRHSRTQIGKSPYLLVTASRCPMWCLRVPVSTQRVRGPWARAPSRDQQFGRAASERTGISERYWRISRQAARRLVLISVFSVMSDSTKPQNLMNEIALRLFTSVP